MKKEKSPKKSKKEKAPKKEKKEKSRKKSNGEHDSKKPSSDQRVDAKDGTTSSRKRVRTEKGSDDDDSQDGADDQDARKPRIRIRLSSAKSASAEKSDGAEKKQGKKRKATPQKTENSNARKKSRQSNAKQSSRSRDGSNESATFVPVEDPMFDVEKLQSEHDRLDNSFVLAHQNLTQRGPFRLPTEIEHKFKDVARMTLNKLNK